MLRRDDQTKIISNGLPLDESDLLQAIRTLPKLACPRDVTEEILRLTVRRPFSPGKGAFAAEKRRLSLRIGMGLAFTAVLLVFIIQREGKSPHPREPMPYPSQLQIEKTQKELLWSLTYTSELLQRSEKKALTQTVLNELPKTWKRVLTKTLYLIQGDGT